MKTMDRLAQSGPFVRCLASLGSAPIERWLRPGNGHADGYDRRGPPCGRGHASASSASEQGSCHPSHVTSSPAVGATIAEGAQRDRPHRGDPRGSDIANYDTRTHAHAHTRTHARTHTHTHTHTCVHVKSIIIVRIGWFCWHRCSQCSYRFTMSIESHASLPYVL